MICLRAGERAAGRSGAGGGDAAPEAGRPGRVAGGRAGELGESRSAPKPLGSGGRRGSGQGPARSSGPARRGLERRGGGRAGLGKAPRCWGAPGGGPQSWIRGQAGPEKPRALSGSAGPGPDASSRTWGHLAGTARGRAWGRSGGALSPPGPPQRKEVGFGRAWSVVLFYFPLCSESGFAPVPTFPTSPPGGWRGLGSAGWCWVLFFLLLLKCRCSGVRERHPQAGSPRPRPPQTLGIAPQAALPRPQTQKPAQEAKRGPTRLSIPTFGSVPPDRPRRGARVGQCASVFGAPGRVEGFPPPPPPPCLAMQIGRFPRSPEILPERALLSSPGLSVFPPFSIFVYFYF